jgi:hypothetical protein
MKTYTNFLISGLIVVIFASNSIAQPNRWQQSVDYTMNVSLNVENHNFEGTQKLVYTNNSPDTLTSVFYHLYFNAFQPGSMMDIRSRNIKDPDRRVTDRISKLSPEEIGMLKPTSLTQDNTDVKYTVVGTILEVELAKPILPNSSTTFDMNFIGQVPLQIRRSGRDNKEGIDFSMAQWYPKISEYDLQGWHPNPYIAREFYGVWGNFDVKITIDPTYIVAASGILQNPNEVGNGFEAPGTKIKKKRKEVTYHYKAEKVHDFVWAADPDYVHKTVQVPDGPLMHYFYQENETTKKTWAELMELSPKMVTYMNNRFGKYGYSDFSVIQGGDGAMEYAMATLINGNGSRSVIGSTLHEMFHSWYYGVLGSNESLYAWMDEGFTSYAGNLTSQYLDNTEKPFERSINSYTRLAKSGLQEPLTTHSDHYNTNSAYSIAAYTIGSLVPYQLAYIMGQEKFDVAFRDYYNTWSFKHPNPTDFERVIEKNADMVLDWFFLDWIGTTKHLDYAIGEVKESEDKVEIELLNKDQRPMPVELLVTYKNGTQERYYMPLRMMRGSKEFTDNIKTTQLADWPWTHPTNRISINAKLSDISKIELDPDQGMVDIDYSNNIWPKENVENE